MQVTGPCRQGIFKVVARFLTQQSTSEGSEEHPPPTAMEGPLETYIRPSIMSMKNA